MIRREQIMKFIPQPKNEDVIVYDTSLKDLIEINVLEEYNKILPQYLSKKNEFELLNNQLNEYKNFINNIYLYNKTWTEEDYLIQLRNEKQTYSTLYGDIKKIEDSISILQKKLEAINEKITIQNAKEEKEIEVKHINIDRNIEKNKKLLEDYRNKIKAYEPILDSLNLKIKENEEEFIFLSDMQSTLKKGDYKCKYCGSIVKVYSENSLIYKRLKNNLEDNKKELEKLLQQKEKIELECVYYKNEISKVKAQLNNDIEFKKNNRMFYAKKSIQILKLEALRDEIINNISEQEKTLRNKSGANTEKFLNTKERINRLETSLNNLKKMKELRVKNQENISSLNSIRKEYESLKTQIIKYIKFLNIYFKIYEQKINNFLGVNYKFKLFEFNDVELKSILKIQYKGINYIDLDEKQRLEVDKEIATKISLFD